MKLNNIFRGIVLTAVIGSAVTGCTEQIKFGDSFIEKTPGGDVTIDTIFNSAEYTQQFLTGIYKNPITTVCLSRRVTATPTVTSVVRLRRCQTAGTILHRQLLSIIWCMVIT